MTGFTQQSDPNAAAIQGLRSSLAGRLVPRVYQVSGRTDIHTFLLAAVRDGGGTVLYASSPMRVPVYIGLEDHRRQRLGLMVYPFRMKRLRTRNRPGDEIRGQLRYGSEESWPAEDHVVARDIAGVDTTLLVGVDPEENLIVGLDPALYDPLPLGISVYAKDQHADEVRQHGWAVWERTNRAGARRGRPRDWKHSLASARSDSWTMRASNAARATWAWTRRCGSRPRSTRAALPASREQPRPGIGWSITST